MLLLYVAVIGQFSYRLIKLRWLKHVDCTIAFTICSVILFYRQPNRLNKIMRTYLKYRHFKMCVCVCFQLLEKSLSSIRMIMCTFIAWNSLFRLKFWKYMYHDSVRKLLSQRG